jgi:predicted ATPase
VHSLPDDVRERWVAHLQTALPDIREITTVQRDEDRHRYIQLSYSSGLEAPSWLISDGTLRLLALTLLAYVPGLSGVYLIEEPENGIHPRAVGRTDIANLLCFSRDEAQATTITRGSDHPRLKRWKGEVDLGTYFASGVLE